MNKEIESAMDSLVSAIKRNSTDNTVSVRVFINSQGCKIDYRTRSPESLVRGGISMRNIKGDFIE